MTELLYTTIIGRILLKILKRRATSVLFGKFMDSRFSIFLIKPFIKHFNIDMKKYDCTDPSSFNDFFTRRLKDPSANVCMDSTKLIAPCDGHISAYHIKKGLVIPVKMSRYSIASLLKNRELAKEYDDGVALVIRLGVNDYHRYHFIDDCTTGRATRLNGELHTVRPIALELLPVFIRNTREYCIMETSNFGEVIQIEVGALLVGRIHNHYAAGYHKRGEEKGYFKYGGSTVILLFKHDSVILKEKLFDNTQNAKETPVSFGDVIGEKKSNYFL